MMLEHLWFDSLGVQLTINERTDIQIWVSNFEHQHFAALCVQYQRPNSVVAIHGLGDEGVHWASMIPGEHCWSFLVSVSFIAVRWRTKTKISDGKGSQKLCWLCSFFPIDSAMSVMSYDFPVKIVRSPFQLVACLHIAYLHYDHVATLDGCSMFFPVAINVI